MGLDKTKKIPVANKSLGSVSYEHEGLRVRRFWDKPETSLLIPFEELEEVLFESGIKALFEMCLFVKDAEVREELGLLDSANDINAFAREDLIALLQGDFQKLVESVEEATPETLSLLGDLAVEIRLDSLSKLNYLSEKTGQDYQSILKIVQDNGITPALKKATPPSSTTKKTVVTPTKK